MSSFLGRFACLAALTLALGASACSSVTVERLGNVAYAPLPPDAPVAVYRDDRSVGVPFQVIGEIEVQHPGKWQVLSESGAIPELSRLARGIGANGIIVDDVGVVVSGVVSRGYTGQARAIRVFDGPPPQGAVFVSPLGQPRPAPPQPVAGVVVLPRG